MPSIETLKLNQISFGVCSIVPFRTFIFEFGLAVHESENLEVHVQVISSIVSKTRDGLGIEERRKGLLQNKTEPAGLSYRVYQKGN